MFSFVYTRNGSVWDLNESGLRLQITQEEQNNSSEWQWIWHSEPKTDIVFSKHKSRSGLSCSKYISSHWSDFNILRITLRASAERFDHQHGTYKRTDSLTCSNFFRHLALRLHKFLRLLVVLARALFLGSSVYHVYEYLLYFNDLLSF